MVARYDFKTGQVMLQKPLPREQMGKRLAQGKTDLLGKFMSKRTGRAFKAMLVGDAEVGRAMSAQ